jgi:hypothetical protein
MERVYTWPRRHPLLVDGTLAACLLALAVFGSGSLRSLGAGELAGDSAITLLVTGPILVRRRHPTAAFAVAIAGILAALSSDLRVSKGGWAFAGGHGAAVHPGGLPASPGLVVRPSHMRGYRRYWPHLVGASGSKHENGLGCA